MHPDDTLKNDGSLFDEHSRIPGLCTKEDPPFGNDIIDCMARDFYDNLSQKLFGWFIRTPIQQNPKL